MPLAFIRKTLEDTLVARSDPDRPDMFGKWLSREAVDALVAPADASTAAVRAWLATAGEPVTETARGDWMTVTLTVAQAEALLGGGARYHRYQHKAAKHLSVLRLGDPEGFALPAAVRAHVDVVGPTTRFPADPLKVRVGHRKGSNLRANKANKRQLFGPSGASVTPDFLRKLYNAEAARGAANTTNIQSCASFLNQYYSPSDLKTFFKKYASDAKITTPKEVIGPNHAGNPGIECELDTQYIMGVGRDIPTIFYSTAGQQPGNPENEPFLVWLSNVAGMKDSDVPKTFSISYGDNEPGVEFGYATRVNAEFQKAGLRGISIMFSSGDGGVAGGQSSPCQDGKFIPTFPAGSPWVTAVGGTTGHKLSALKTASFSSGGFSDRWARPAWQDAAIKGYFASSPSGLPAKSHYNQTGAGIPDVAAQGENFDVIDGGFPMPVAGTSCSSPTFTGIARHNFSQNTFFQIERRCILHSYGPDPHSCAVNALLQFSDRWGCSTRRAWPRGSPRSATSTR